MLPLVGVTLSWAKKLLMIALSDSTASPMERAAEATSSEYLDRLMRRGCFEALWPLFAKAQKPAKELTESYAALTHLRPFMTGDGPYRVVHVGDGAHARTGAMFSLKTLAHSISVDPQLNLPLVDAWRARFGILRLDCRKARIQDVAVELNALPAMPTLVTFVHAHVSVDEVLAQLRWDIAFTLACCLPGKQLSQKHESRSSGNDQHVLSTGRQYQVLFNCPSARGVDASVARLRVGGRGSVTANDGRFAPIAPDVDA